MMEYTTDSKLLRVSIIAFGTRGDIQPFVALAVELTKKYKVRFLTCMGYETFLRDFDLDYIPVWPADPNEMIKNNKHVQEAMATGGIVNFKKEREGYSMECVQLVMKELSLYPPDFFINTGFLSEYFGLYLRYVMKIPVLNVQYTLHMNYNRNIAPLGMPTLPFGMHYYLIIFFARKVYQSFESFDNGMVSIGRPKLCSYLTKEEYLQEIRRYVRGNPSYKVIVCQSLVFRDALAPNVNPEKCIYVGSSILDTLQQSNHSSYFGGDANKQKLIYSFLNQYSEHDKKPIYCGWGSMVCISPEHMVKLVVTALYQTNQRAIVLGGVAGLSMDVLRNATSDKNLLLYAEENIYFTQTLSHELILPKVKCTVHHGGAGTTEAALRAGVPTIITPMFFDQFAHSKAINMLGVGIGHVHVFQKLTVESLAASIRRVISDEKMIRRSKEVSKFMCKEKGKVAAVEQIDKFIEKTFKGDIDTTWKYLDNIESDLILPEIILKYFTWFMILIISFFIVSW